MDAVVPISASSRNLRRRDPKYPEAVQLIRRAFRMRRIYSAEYSKFSLSFACCGSPDVIAGRKSRRISVCIGGYI